jgi:GNAT superfamily N-acetyltransferase
VTIEIRAATREERPAVQDLIDLAFDAESYGPSLANPCTSVGNSEFDPYDRPENTRLLFVDGQLVSALHVLVREVYACRLRLGFAIITDVCTHPDRRRRGYLRLLLADAERHLRERGLCYAVLFGRLAFYTGSLGWHWCGEKRTTLDVAWLLPPTQSQGAVGVTEATPDDVPFLAGCYGTRYGSRFGPVVRSHEYWRRWSLPRQWDGRYRIVREGRERIGYFRAGDGVDEVAWVPGAAETVLAAAAHGEAETKLWVDESDAEVQEALRRLFGEVPRVSVDAMGQVTEDTGPAAMLARLRRGGSAMLVKWLAPGPGLLSRVSSTEALTQVMAERRWTMLDGDMA